MKEFSIELNKLPDNHCVGHKHIESNLVKLVLPTEDRTHSEIFFCPDCIKALAKVTAEHENLKSGEVSTSKFAIYLEDK
jgi:hypothetical protein